MAIGKGLWHGATQQLGMRFPVDPLHEASPGEQAGPKGKEVIRAMIRRSWTPDLPHARNRRREFPSAGGGKRSTDEETA
jgi:hypothetical protein